MTYQMRRGLRLSTGLLGLFAVAALGGCGGGGVGTNPTTAVSNTYGIVPSGAAAPTITYNSNDTFTVVSGSTTLTLQHLSTTADINGFKAYTDGSGNYLWASDASRDASAAFGSVDNGSGGKVAGTQYGRLADGTVPNAGSATFNGYYGAVVVDSSGVIQKVISGDAALAANFGSGGSVTGTISNRKYYNTSTSAPDGSLNDMTLSGATMDGAGNFTGGTASGGKYTSTADNTSGGTYEGLIGGTNGSQISGGVVITHDNGTGGITTETGAFIGN